MSTVSLSDTFPHPLPLWVCVNHQEDGELCDVHDPSVFTAGGERHLPLFTSLKAAEQFADDPVAGKPKKISRRLTLLDVLERCRHDGVYHIAVNPTDSMPGSACESRYHLPGVIGQVLKSAGLRRLSE